MNFHPQQTKDGDCPLEKLILGTCNRRARPTDGRKPITSGVHAHEVQGKTELASCQDRSPPKSQRCPDYSPAAFPKTGAQTNYSTCLLAGRSPSIATTYTQPKNGVPLVKQLVNNTPPVCYSPFPATEKTRLRGCLSEEGGLPTQARAFTYRSSRKSKLAASIIQTPMDVKRHPENSACPQMGRWFLAEAGFRPHTATPVSGAEPFSQL